MGNSLLDFVLALVRDPEVANRYAADPAGVLADAHLTGVTIADVDNLIPVVADSLAAATPAFGAATGGADVVTGNVWTSGAAVAALDSFAISSPSSPDPVRPVVTVQAEQLTGDHLLEETHLEMPAATAPEEAPAQSVDPMDPTAPAWPDAAAWQHPHTPDSSGFDVF